MEIKEIEHKICADLLFAFDKILKESKVVLPLDLENMIETELGELAKRICNEEDNIRDLFIYDQLAKCRAYFGIGDAKVTQGGYCAIRNDVIKKIIKLVQLKYYDIKEKVDLRTPLSSIYLEKKERELAEKHTLTRTHGIKTIKDMIKSFDAMGEKLRNAILSGTGEYIKKLMDVCNPELKRIKKIYRLKGILAEILSNPNNMDDTRIEILTDYFGMPDGEKSMQQETEKK